MEKLRVTVRNFREEAIVQKAVMERANNLCECSASVKEHPKHKNPKGACGRPLSGRYRYYRINPNRPNLPDNVIVVCSYCSGRIQSERHGIL